MKGLVKVLASLAIAISLALGSAVSAFASGTVSTYTAQVATTAQTNIVGLGDSVPAGTNSDGPNFVDLVGQAASATSNSSVTNFAVPGLTTSGLLSQLQVANVQQSISSADIVLVTIGANDLSIDDAGSSTEATTLSDEGARLDQILDLINTLRKPGAQVVVTDYWNVFEDGAVAADEGAAYVAASLDLTSRLNTVLTDSATAHGDVVVDLVAPFESTGDVTSLLADDGDHPNAAGHALIAKMVLAAINPSAAPASTPSVDPDRSTT